MVPKFIVQLVSSVVNAVVKTIAAGLGIPTTGRTAAARPSAAAALTAAAPNPRRAVATSNRQPAASTPSAQRRSKPAQQRADRTASGGPTGHSSTGHSAR